MGARETDDPALCRPSQCAHLWPHRFRKWGWQAALGPAASARVMPVGRGQRRPREPGGSLPHTPCGAWRRDGEDPD